MPLDLPEGRAPGRADGPRVVDAVDAARHHIGFPARCGQAEHVAVLLDAQDLGRGRRLQVRGGRSGVDGGFGHGVLQVKGAGECSIRLPGTLPIIHLLR
ncbi:hypothetical protein ACFQHO_53460 [Actinomadura yumaensis]|uniref:hypothetical protein n=1 Tax=Actinomadura yumaensis TaxID=111807 RepID=UPI003610C9D0